MRTKVRVAFLVCLAVTCWYGMMLVHESGHTLAALATGTRIERFEFPLLGFSRTDVSSNPHSLAIAWCGPLLGAAVPLFVSVFLRRWKVNSYVVEVFAAFCLLANGGYIGLGSFEHIGDAGDILQRGSNPVLLWLFGIAASAAGMLMLHRLGPALGIAQVRKSDLITVTVAASILILVAIFN